MSTAGPGDHDGGHMRAGIVSPVATLNPRFFEPWEAEAGIEAIATIASEAERLGYHHVTASEHVAVHESKVHLRGRSYWDPLATLGYVAALTRRIRLVTNVVVLGFHHPLAIAKRYGTLDRISGGRLILGVGIGSAIEEFELLGAPTDRRGARADDALRAIRASFAREEPEYHGEFYDFAHWVVVPCGVQEDLPIWVGGRSERSLMRAIELGDGWSPQGARHELLREQLDRAFDSEAFARRVRPFDVILATPPDIDPSSEPERLRDAIGRAREMGATILNVRTRHRSLAQCLEQLEAYAAVATSTGLVTFG